MIESHGRDNITTNTYDNIERESEFMQRVLTHSTRECICKIKKFVHEKRKSLYVIAFLFIVYTAIKFAVGVPIINIPLAVRRIPSAVFIYCDRADSKQDAYYYVLFRNRELYTFCGGCKYDKNDILSDDYMRYILKARSRYISNADYKKILNWAWEADFYSEHDLLPDSCDGRGAIYHYKGKVRAATVETLNMIEDSEYLLNEIFNNEKFYDVELYYLQEVDDKFTWIYNGKHYVPQIMTGDYGDIVWE